MTRGLSPGVAGAGPVAPRDDGSSSRAGVYGRPSTCSQTRTRKSEARSVQAGVCEWGAPSSNGDPHECLVAFFPSMAIGPRTSSRRHLGAVIATLVLMTALPFGAAEATAAMHKTHKPKAHKISMIYMDEYHPHGKPAIWAVRPNGKGLHMVSYGLDAHISPDGKRIYCKCAKHGGIGVMKPDGSGLRRMGPGPRGFRQLLSLSQWRRDFRYRRI